MSDFSTCSTFPSLSEAQLSLAGIAKLQGFKLAKRTGPSQVPGASVPTTPVYDGVASFGCTMKGCRWFVSIIRVAQEPEEQWRVYTVHDKHKGNCKPARRRVRQSSFSSVQSFETDESELGIPQEVRGRYIRSPSLAVPVLTKAKPPPPQTLPSLVKSVTSEGTPELTPATTQSSNNEARSPAPDTIEFSNYLDELMRSLDMPIDENGDLANMDSQDLLASVNQPMDLSDLLGLDATTSNPSIFSSNSAALPEWKKGSTGAHDFLANMGREERNKLQPRLERAVSVLQNMVPSQTSGRSGSTTSIRPFADAHAAFEKVRSASPFSVAIHSFQTVADNQQESSSTGQGEALDGMQYLIDDEEEGGVQNDGDSDNNDTSSDEDIPAELLINTSRSSTNNQSTGPSGIAPTMTAKASISSADYTAAHIPSLPPALSAFCTRQASAEQYISPLNLLSPSKSQDWGENDMLDDYAPVASTSALPPSAFTDDTTPTDEPEEPEQEDPDDIDIYQIFFNYEAAEKAIMANGKSFGLPLEVKWRPGRRHLKGACLQCVHKCGYEIHLSDDSLGNWRLVSVNGQHEATCQPSYRKRNKTRGKKAQSGISTLRNPALKPVNKKKVPTNASTAYNLNKRKDNKGKGRADSPNLPSSPEARRALSPISSFPRQRRNRSSEDSSSPGVVVQSSWVPQHPSPKRKKDSSSSISPQKKKRLSEAGATADKPIDLELDSDVEEQPSQIQRINGDDDDEIIQLPPPLRPSHPAGHEETAPQTSSPADPASYARKKLPTDVSPKHRTPTKPFHRRTKPREKRIFHAIIEEPVFIETKKDLPRDLAAEGLNGGYWNRLDGAGNRIEGNGRKDKGKGRAEEEGERESCAGDSDDEDFEGVRHSPRSVRTRRSRGSLRAEDSAVQGRARRKRSSLAIVQDAFDYGDPPEQPFYEVMDIESEIEEVRPIPELLKANMSLYDAGFNKASCQSLSKAGFTTVRQLVIEGLDRTSEDFSAFRDLFIPEEVGLKAGTNKEDIKTWIRRIVGDIRARALIAWEHDGMQGDESDEEDEPEEGQPQEDDDSNSNESDNENVRQS